MVEIKRKTTKIKPWILYTLLFDAITILLFSIIMWNVFYGVISLFLLILTILVGIILRAFFDRDKHKKVEIKFSKKADIKNSGKLLRYATALLAFLSLFTTAEGMKSFVFGEDSSWMAFLGSFAVQSILIVFSLLLCQFFVQISVLEWNMYVKKVISELMILFFRAALLVSSTFSFCFIANNAYKNSWPSDSETIIQEFLSKEYKDLREENNVRGKNILDYINANAASKLSPIIIKLKTKKENKWKKRIVAIIQNYKKESEFNAFRSRTEEEMIQTYPQYKNDIVSLFKSYKGYLKDYKDAVKYYNNIVNNIKKYNTSNLDYDSMLTQSENWITNIGQKEANLENRKKNITNLKSYKFNIDFSSVRSDYKSGVDSLKKKFKDLKKSLNDIKNNCNNINNNSSDNKLNDILSNIYLLDISGGNKVAKSNNADVENILADINKLALKVSKDGDSDSDVLGNIVDIKDALKQYKNYLELKTKLNNENIKTYIINLQNKKNVSNSKDNSEVVNITYNNWRKVRNNDFNQFCSCLKLLPDTSIITSKDKKSKNTKYDTDNILDKAKTYQRDLLGDLTDFEKAFNYFKYKFPMMAVFSAVIAIFFDFGSFLTGCFLYVTEYFKCESEREESSQSE